MGHSVYIHVMNKEQLRSDRIKTILNELDGDGVEYKEMSGGVVAIMNYDDKKEQFKNKTVACLSTDYFGGIGHQRATIYKNGKKIFDETDEYDMSFTPINSALETIGVIREGDLDEFDTIGLGGYRNNESFYE
jgi:hypothetical protein